MQVTLGGDRLGSGKKMKVDLHNYGRSTHNLSHMWKSTMAAGTLVPFLKKVVLPGDTWDIDLDCRVLTLPTNGPLFGSYKVQLDIFVTYVRLYQGLLHMNAVGIGNRMNQVKLPIIEMISTDVAVDHPDIDNSQVNPSSLLAYLGIRGVGISATPEDRQFNAVPILGYWEIVKQYYSNKQEEVGYVLHTPSVAIVTTVTSIEIDAQVLPQAPTANPIDVTTGSQIEINYTGATPIPSQILFNSITHGLIPFDQLVTGVANPAGQLTGTYNRALWGDDTIDMWQYQSATDPTFGKPELQDFPLVNIDTMRKNILASTAEGATFNITAAGLPPYVYLNGQPAGIPNVLSSQEGLAIKTYQSDLFNNWLETSWIDDINQATAISTAGASFTQDQLLLSKKIYDMMNRIAVSGGTYYNWIEAVYTEASFDRCETPIYMGGLIKQLVFQEVVSNSNAETASGTQPLGTLAGKGVLAGKHKGGKVVVKTNEIGYIIGIVSLTPHLDYSQGNDWDINLLTMDDFHKPALDQIGFEDSINEYRAWWSTFFDTGAWMQTSAGKIPAWINYMTAVNKTYGNFAVKNNQMFMTLNRRYEVNPSNYAINDLTTYIDPSKFNFVFAQTELDAQNFWVQIAIDCTVRRKMSGKLMPNL